MTDKEEIDELMGEDVPERLIRTVKFLDELSPPNGKSDGIYLFRRVVMPEDMKNGKVPVDTKQIKTVMQFEYWIEFQLYDEDGEPNPETSKMICLGFVEQGEKGDKEAELRRKEFMDLSTGVWQENNEFFMEALRAQQDRYGIH